MANRPSGPVWTSKRTQGVVDIDELRAGMQLRGAGSSVRSLQITSARRMGGLADLVDDVVAALVRAGMTVDVVDADLRSPRSANGKVTSSLGSVGGDEGTDDPAAFVGSRAFQEKIAGMRDQVDLVVILAPPVLECPDALLIGKVADATLLVAELGDRLRGVVDSVSRLRQVGQPLMGIVLGELARPEQSGSGRQPCAWPNRTGPRRQSPRRRPTRRFVPEDFTQAYATFRSSRGGRRRDPA
jgi:hypothetical protein